MSAVQGGSQADDPRLRDWVDTLPLSRIEVERLAEPVAGWLAARRATAVRLRTDRSADGCEFDSRWRLIANDEVEPDL